MGPLKPATEMSGTAPQSLVEKIVFSVVSLLVGDQLIYPLPVNGRSVLLDSRSSKHTENDHKNNIVSAPASKLSMMENDMSQVPIDMAGRNSVVIDGIPSQTIPNALVVSDSFDLNNQNQTLAGYPVLSTLQGETFCNPHIDPHITNRAGVFDSDALVTSLGRNVSSSHPICNIEFQEQFAGGTPISSTPLATLLAARSGFQENLNNLAISVPSIYPMEVLRTYTSNDLNSSMATAVNSGYDVLTNKFPSPPELGRKTPVRAGFQPYSSIGNVDSNGWMSSNGAISSMDYPYGSLKHTNELSLSLATSQPFVIGVTNIQDQCSDISCSGVNRHCFNEPRFGAEQTSSNCKELSLSFDSCRPAQFSHVISGSRYVHVIQEILAQIASYSLENLDLTGYSTYGIGTGSNVPFSSSCHGERGTLLMGSDEFPDVDARFEVQMEPALQRRAIEAKKTQLLTLLEVVDDRYNQCLDEIHTVISAFHAATELDPQVHTRFALQTISFLYKNLRERISNQILAMGAHFDSGWAREKEISPETSFIRKQWALQKLKRKDQLWRPQRGLPERSVSVLRAWMFQNFLHPYPKDAEKHLLAVKSGLTRSQVSNWFINARVRLWKPMIEEMYAEMNRRKARRNEEGTDSNHRSHISFNNQRFNMN